jgi:Tol biopolymer transport system component
MRWVLLVLVVAVAYPAATLLAASGTGGDVAFYSDRAGGGGSGADLYLMKGDGTDVRRLTHGRVAHEGEFDSLSALGVDPPHWSPDRTKILFAGSRDGVYLVGANGTGQRQLATNAYLPEWSPDGRQIVFTRGRGNTVDLWVMRANGSGQRRLAPNGLWAQWSPTGRTIAFLRFREKTAFRGPADLWVMRPDRSQQRRIAKNAFDVNWSPNGRWISFTRQRGGLVSIFLIRERGRERLVVDDSSGVTPVAWSPGGQQLAYVGEHNQKTDIAVVRINGTGKRWITNDATKEAFLAWTADSRRIAFTINFIGSTANPQAGFELFSVDARGGGRMRLTRTKANDVAPAFKPTR